MSLQRTGDALAAVKIRREKVSQGLVGGYRSRPAAFPIVGLEARQDAAVAFVVGLRQIVCRLRDEGLFLRGIAASIAIRLDLDAMQGVRFAA